MKHHTPSFTRRNVRAHVAAVLSYLLLAGQMAPLALAAKSRAPRTAPPADVARESAGEAPRLTAAPAPLAAPAPAAFAPTITATKVDTYAGQPAPALPGSTITYTVTINNAGPDAATNLTLTDTVDPNTTITGTPVASPIAVDETYNVLGNVRIAPNAAGGLLANDNNPNTGNTSGLTASGPTTGPTNGQATVSSDGSFTYNPNPGFTGSDSFTYTVTSANGSDTATVTLNVGNGTATPAGANDPVIWFVDDNAAAGGDGRLTSPFNCLVGAGCFDPTAADQAGDTIFVYEGTYNDTGALTLLNTQKLVGQGATDTLVTITGVTVPPHSDALPPTKEDNVALNAPTINSTGNGVTLGQNNVLRGFNVGNVPAASIKINGAGFGQLTIGKTTEPDVSTSGTGRALFLQNGTLANTSGLGTLATTSSSGAAAVLLTQITAGALTAVTTSVAGAAAGGVEVNNSSADIGFGNTDVAAGTDGVVLANNAAGTRSFGTLTITGGTGIGFRHLDPDGAGAGVGGGAVSVTGAMTVTNPGGNGIDVDSSNANLSFAATTVNKGSTGGNGVELTNNASRTIGFTSLAVTTTTGFALLTNNSGTVNAGGGSLTQSGAGGGAASLTNTTLGLTFTSVSSNGGVNGLLFNVAGGTFTSGTTNLQNNTGIGLSMLSSSVAANFGNTTVNSSAADAVDLSLNTGNITFAALNLSPDSNFRGLDAAGNTGTITATSGDIATTNAAAVNVDGPAGRTPLALVLNNVDVTGGAGPDNGVNLTDVSGSFAVNDATLATSISNTTGTGIVVNNSTATVNFGNTSVTGTGNANGDDIGTGIFLTNNGGAVTFGALTLTPDAGERALHATDTDAASAAGQINISSGTVTVTNDTAVEIVGASAAARTPINIVFTEIDSSGGPNGILIQNASDGGNGFRVLGSGTTDGSGGTIANITNRGASFIDAADIQLNNMTFTNVGTTNGADPTSGASACGEISPGGGGNTGCHAGIHAVNVTVGLALTNIDMNGGNQQGINGDNVTNFTLANSNVLNFGDQVRESGVKINNLLGTSSITNSTIQGNEERQIEVQNDTGTLTNFTVSSVTVRGSTVPNGAQGILFSGAGTATMKLTVTNSTFGGTLATEQLRSTYIQSDVQGGSPTMEVTVTGSTFRGGGAALSAAAVDIIQAFSGNVKFNISNNPTFLNMGSHVINLNMQTTSTAGSILQGKVEGNTVGDTSSQTSATTSGSGIRFRSLGKGKTIGLVNNNTVRGVTERGIFGDMAEQTDANTNFQFTITNNTVDIGGGVTEAGIQVHAGIIAPDTGTLCADIANNTSASAGTPGLDHGIRVRQRASATMQLPGYTGAPTDNTAVQNYLDARNPATTDTISANATGAPGGGFTNTPGGAPCQQPTLPSGPVESTQNVAPGGGGEDSAALRGIVVAPTSDGANVTSRPFVSPIRRLAKSQAAQGVEQQQLRGAASIKTVALQTRGNAAKGDQTRPAAAAQSMKDIPAKKDGGKKPAGASQFDTPIFNPPVVNGDTLTWNIGTLPAGASVTITFQVTIDTPFTGGSPQVSNQGTVTADGGVSVLTDDPSEVGANNPTVTPVLVQNIRARDGQAPEPPTGTAPLLFTITLSSPAAAPIMVNYATADGGATPATGGADCNTAGVDYITKTDTATFAVGEQVRTVSVDICSDGPAEPDETFLLNLTGTNSGTILDNQAVGTITPAAPAGTTLISELRTFGPGTTNDPADDFVEIYNNTDAPVTVAASDASAGWGVYTAATCDSAPTLLGTIPNGTVIPARGHFLLTGSAYSLANYGGTGAAAGNLTMAADLPNNANVAVFSTSDITNLSTVTRLDAVGFGSNTGGAVCDLLREGATTPAVANNLTLLGQYSVLRDPCGKGGNPNTFGLCPTTGNPKDSNVNSSDFFMVDPNATDAGAGQRIGAAGPENIASPVRRDATIGISLLDGSVAAAAPPNRVRDFTSDPGNNSTHGTLSIRRRFTNNTGSPVTRLRFRIVDISTFSSANADLRARTAPASVSVTVNDPATCGAKVPAEPAPCSATVLGTTLEEPPSQPNGGGFNSTLSAGTITTGSTLAPGASINLQFLLGIQQTGSFKFYFIIEALP